jgi:hypothetical protein
MTTASAPRGNGGAPGGVATPAHPVTELRSSWLRSSLSTLELRGHLPRYQALATPEERELVFGSIVEPWIPIEHALVHYSVCERLELGDAELFDIGHSIARMIHRSYGALAVHLVKSAGATPWHVLEDGMPLLWKRIWRGGHLVISRTGPKDARVDVNGWPLAKLKYCRRTMRGVGQALCEMFSQRVYSHEVPQRRGDVASYRFTWV